MKLRAVSLSLLLLAACAERPGIGITISNTPEPIENCGKKIGGC